MTKFFKLHSNGKVCRVLEQDTNLVGGRGFDSFVRIVEPDHSGVVGWDYEMWVAVCRGEFVEGQSPSHLPAAQAVAGGTHMSDQPVDLLITANERAALARFLDAVPLCYFEEQGQHDQFHLETLAIRMRSYL